MKRIVVLSFIWVLLLPSVWAQNSNVIPSVEEMKAVNDSILTEAYQLYLHEKIAWVMEDIFLESQSEAINDVEGWIPTTEDGVTVKGIFFNKDKTKALFEASVNIQTGETSSTSTARDLTAKEIEEIKVHQNVVNAIYSLDSIPPCPEGCTFNNEVLRMGEDLYRVYWMLGTTEHGVIPFGCDFSYDCDSNGKIKEYRRYHQTFIPSPLTYEGEPVSAIFHSHTSICPYIAPTDIALFLLYGYEFSELTGFKVYSPTFKCYFVFNAETYEITIENP